MLLDIRCPTSSSFLACTGRVCSAARSLQAPEWQFGAMLTALVTVRIEVTWQCVHPSNWRTTRWSGMQLRSASAVSSVCVMYLNKDTILVLWGEVVYCSDNCRTLAYEVNWCRLMASSLSKHHRLRESVLQASTLVIVQHYKTIISYSRE